MKPMACAAWVVVGLGHVVGGHAEALAESPRVHTRAAVARAVGGFQSAEFGLGPAFNGGLGLPLVPQLGLGVELGFLYLTDGKPPSASGVADHGGASAWTTTGFLQLRPFARALARDDQWHSGIWASAGVGGTLTGNLPRALLDAALGFDGLIGDGTYALGPFLGWTHVFQGQNELRPEDANILLVGLHLMFDGSERGSTDDAVRPPGSSSGQPPPAAIDQDGDGIPDAADACPTQAEDLDGIDDVDGCIDPDDDGDGVPDAADACPLVPEDLDGFEDVDGCPEARFKSRHQERPT